MSKDCIFCKIATGEIPAYKIHENSHFLAILDINPAACGHVLVIPKEHFEALLDMSSEYAREFLSFTQQAARAVMEVSGAQGFNLLQNNGAVAGQSVFHFHAHIIPRVPGDGLNFNWPPGTPTKELLTELTEKIAGLIQNDGE